MVEVLSLSDAAYKPGVLASICSMVMIPNTLPRLEVNFTEAVWDHLDKKQNKKHPTSKEELQMSFQTPEELFPMII